MISETSKGSRETAQDLWPDILHSMPTPGLRIGYARHEDDEETRRLLRRGPLRNLLQRT